VCFATLACGGAPDDGEGLERSDVGQMTFALTAVPAGIQCIQVNVDMADYPWTHLATQNFAATPGSAWSGTVALGSFTTGLVWVTAGAYNAACASIGTTPNWVSDPVLINLTPGTPGSAPLNFRQNYGVVASGNFAPSVADVSVGTYTTGLRLVDNTVRIVGTFILAPTSLTNVAELSVGGSHACARKIDGTVWCWGNNSYGQLGNGTTTSSLTTPVQATGIAGATTVSVGDITSCASTSTSTYCWGYNGQGAIGNGSTVNALSPVQLGIPGSDKIATTQSHTCAAVNDGTVRCWGDNTGGALGNGGTVDSTVPVATALRGAVSVAVGDAHSCAVTTDDLAYCFGVLLGEQLVRHGRRRDVAAAESTRADPLGSPTGADGRGRRELGMRVDVGCQRPVLGRQRVLAAWRRYEDQSLCSSANESLRLSVDR
jgi:hypothetical protein